MKYLLTLLIIFTQISLSWAKDEYMALIIDGEKVGHSIHSTKLIEEKIHTIIEMNLSLQRLGTPVTLNQKEESIETISGIPLSFSQSTLMAGMETKMEGIIENETLNLNIRSGSIVKNQIIPWPEGALLSEGQRLFVLKKGLKPGSKYSMKTFRPELLDSVDMEISVGEKELIDLFGRVKNLKRVEMDLVTQKNRITTVNYVDEDFNIFKAEIPIMHMTMEMIACSKEFALSQNSTEDFLAKSLIQSPIKITREDLNKTLYYQITPTENKNFELPRDDNQTFTKDENEVLHLVISPERGHFGELLPYNGNNKEALDALKPSTFVQSEHEKIIELARQAAGNEKDILKAGRKIEDFVYSYISKKDLSVGFATAEEVAITRQGDCTEHAVLTAAMCRAMGIPAKVVMGIVYAPMLEKTGVFGGHAWTEIYVGEKWVGLDATRAPTGFSSSHIKFASGKGEPADFFSIMNILGNFKIVSIARTQ
jgi:hypothetical protein